MKPGLAKSILSFFSGVVIALVVIVLIVLALAGCHPPKPVTPGPLPDPNVVMCRTPVYVTTADACPDQFTADYHPCAVCHGGVACVADDIQIYCITSTCAKALATGECSLVKTPPSRR